MWKDLTLRERHRFIKIAVQCGVYDLDIIRSLYDKNENKYDTGGEPNTPAPAPTKPNRQPIDIKPILDKTREDRPAKYTNPESPMEQIKDFTDKLQEERFNREFMEWLLPSYTSKYVDVRRTVPVAEARPTFLKTFQTGGTKPDNPPQYQWSNDVTGNIMPSIPPTYRTGYTEEYPNVSSYKIGIDNLAKILREFRYKNDTDEYKINWNEKFVYNEKDKFNNYVNFFFPRFMSVIEDMYPNETHNEHLRRASYLVAHTAYENGYGTSRLFREGNNLGGDLDAKGNGIIYDSYESYIRHKLPSMDKRFPGWNSAPNYSSYSDSLFQRELDSLHSESKYDYCTEPRYKDYKRELESMNSMRNAVQNYSGIDMGGF
jgi:hypothetical protein